MKKVFPVILLVSLFCFLKSTEAQTKVVLDNYFNHETNPKTNKVYHYTWTDEANSGFSQLGDIFKAKGADISTMQVAPDKANLKNADIYIIVDPDTKEENPNPAYIDKKSIGAIEKWVKKGGVLVLMANDSGNCEFQHLNNLAARFGMHFNEVRLSHVDGKQWEMGAVTNLPDHPVFKGIHKIYLKDVSSLTLSASAKPVLTKDGHVFMAENYIGKGTVFAVGDPWIYNEYIGHKYLPKSFENRQAAENLVVYLLNMSRSAGDQ